MRNKLIILIGIIGLMIPFKVNALTGSVSLTCDKIKASPGSTITCSIKGNITEEVSSVHAEVDLGSNLTLNDVQSSSTWEGNGEGGVYDLYTEDNKKGSFDIGSFIVKVGNVIEGADTYISLKNVTLSDASFKEQNFSVSKVDVRIGSTVNALTNITVSGGNLTFNENTTSYDMTIDSDKTTINATKKDSNSTITGDVGDKILKYGKNVFKITVTSESGAKKDYTLNITRPDNRSRVNTLDSLKLSEGNINFKKDTLKYNLTVENKVTSIKVDATLTDNKSSFVSGYGSRTVVLKEGTNSVLIKVKAENEVEKTYTITVTRKSDGTKSDNNYLSEIKLSEGKIDFDKEELEYNVSVLYDVEEIELTVKTEDSKAKYEIAGENKLEVGENKFVITVTAESGATREYTVIVDRKAEDEELSSNTKLSSLKVNGYELNFNSDVYKYNLQIKSETSLIIDYELDDEKSFATIEGNNNLENGSIIKLTVTAEDGSASVYEINILKEESSNLWIFIVIGIVVVLLIIVLLVIFKKKNNSNNIGNNNMNNNVNNMDDLAIKQNTQYWGNSNQPIQNIGNITYTQNNGNVNSQNNNLQ